MEKEKNVLEFYVLCTKLKNVVRSGWKAWGVDRERVESIAEHIYGVQMLAICMWSEYHYDIDIKKTLAMLALHELEEIIIGDVTQFDKNADTKQNAGHLAVEKILKPLCSGQKIKDLIFEFDAYKTPEAKFAFQCDKLECDLQCKLYDEENCVNLKTQINNLALQDENVQKLMQTGKSWSEMWLLFSQRRYNYDQNFLAVSNYAMKNNLSEQTK
ncbi:MAG: HD domain-containing protein [Clostridia bacterium]|nr:HD domain-containing protein [Clostridia bacterium]